MYLKKFKILGKETSVYIFMDCKEKYALKV